MDEEIDSKYLNYTAVIRRVSDGAERITVHNIPWYDDYDGGSWFYWTEGNYGCDCNRYLSFERAGGSDPAIDDAVCGRGAYLVVEFRFFDGTTLEGPDVPDV